MHPRDRIVEKLAKACEIDGLNMLITNKINTRIVKYDGFSTNYIIGELNSDSKEISI